MAYEFTVHCIVYSKVLLNVTMQKCSSLTGWKTDYHRQPISELLHFFHCLHAQEKHVATLFGIYCTVVNGEKCCNKDPRDIIHITSKLLSHALTNTL